jgi:hypothetical protein
MHGKCQSRVVSTHNPITPPHRNLAMARFKHPTVLNFSRPNLQRQRSSTCCDALPATFTYKHPLPVSHSYPLVPTSGFQTPRCVDRLSAGDRRAANVRGQSARAWAFFSNGKFPLAMPFGCVSETVGGAKALKSLTARRIGTYLRRATPVLGRETRRQQGAVGKRRRQGARALSAGRKRLQSCRFPMACTDGGSWNYGGLSAHRACDWVDRCCRHVVSQGVSRVRVGGKACVLSFRKNF